MIRISRRSIRASALIAAAALAVTACGSSSSSSSRSTSAAANPTSSTASSATAPTGTPLKVGVIAGVNTPLGSFPEVFAADKAAARAVNAAGGIKGHPVQVLTCNGLDNPNNELSCAKQLLQQGAVAFVGGTWIAADAAINKALTQAHVANIASSTPQAVDYSSPIAFQIDLYAGSYVACATKTMAALAKSTKIAPVALSLPVALSTLDNAVKPAAEANGLTWTNPVTFPVSTTNFAPVVQQVVNSHIKFVLPVMSPVALPAFLAAASQTGAQLTYCAAEGLATPGALTKAGTAAGSLYATLSHPPISAAGQYPEIAEFLSQMKTEASAGDSSANITPNTNTPFALRAWLGMQVFKDVASGMSGAITPSSFLSAIGKAKVSLGNLETINFAKPTALGPFRRVFNANFFFVKFDTSKKDYELVPGTTVNLLQH